MIGLLSSVGALLSRLIWMVAPGWGAPCWGSWYGTFFGLAVVISYLALFIQLYNDRYKPNQQGKAAAMMDKKSNHTTLFKSEVRANSMTGRVPPEFSSPVRAVSSMPCQQQRRRSGAGLCSTPEDAYASMRYQFINHPLIVADREQWRGRQQNQTSMDNTETEGEHKEAEGEAKKRRVFGKSEARL
jgi:hypothetical protein